MTRPELADKVAGDFTKRFGPAMSDPWRGRVRTSWPVLERYEAELPRHQKYVDPTRATPSLVAGGLPLCVQGPEDDTEADLSLAFQQLEEAARAEDIPSFVRLADEIDWHRMSADQLAQAIRHARWLPAHNTVHRLAALGGQLHPSNPYLTEAARLFAPPKFLGWVKSDPASRANREWLRREWRSYRGQWVVVKNGELLGHSENIEDVRHIVRKNQCILLTRIF